MAGVARDPAWEYGQCAWRGEIAGGYREALPTDLPLEDGLLRGEGRVGHDGRDERVRRRREFDRAQQAHRRPEPAIERLRPGG